MNERSQPAQLTSNDRSPEQLVKYLDHLAREMRGNLVSSSGGVSMRIFAPDASAVQQAADMLRSSIETGEHRDTARLRWLANTVLCTDYGDNNHPNKLIGWRVMEFIAPVIYGKTLEEAIDAGMDDEFHRRRARGVKPTIESLEALLKSEDTTPVQILPDGSVREVTPQKAGE